MSFSELYNTQNDFKENCNHTSPTTHGAFNQHPTVGRGLQLERLLRLLTARGATDGLTDAQKEMLVDAYLGKGHAKDKLDFGGDVSSALFFVIAVYTTWSNMFVVCLSFVGCTDHQVDDEVLRIYETALKILPKHRKARSALNDVQRRIYLDFSNVEDQS